MSEVAEAIARGQHRASAWMTALRSDDPHMALAELWADGTLTGAEYERGCFVADDLVAHRAEAARRAARRARFALLHPLHVFRSLR